MNSEKNRWKYYYNSRIQAAPEEISIDQIKEIIAGVAMFSFTWVLLNLV